MGDIPITDLSILEGIAEVAVSLTGFAGIVATFQFREDSTPSSGQIVGLSIMVSTGLAGVFLSYLPFLLLSFTSDLSIVWPAASLVMILYMMWLMNFVHSHMRGKVNNPSARVIFSLLQTVSALIVVLLILNCTGYGLEPGIGPYLLGLLFGLFVVAVNFWRLLLLPLWKKHHAGKQTVTTE